MQLIRTLKGLSFSSLRLNAGRLAINFDKLDRDFGVATELKKANLVKN
jgi:hypothetical protein